jgi:hypothetical protein
MAQYEASQIPDPSVFPRTTYGFKTSVVEHSKEGEPLKIKVRMSILAPDSRKGQRYTETFTLGTEEDPEANDPRTKREGMTSFNWQRWLNFVRVTGVACGETKEEVDALNATLPEFVADMNVRPGKDRTTGELTGRKFNSLVRYYEMGRKEPREPNDEDQPMQTTKAAVGGGLGMRAAAKSDGAETVLCDACEPPKRISAKVFESHKARHIEE